MEALLTHLGSTTCQINQPSFKNRQTSTAAAGFAILSRKYKFQVTSGRLNFSIESKIPQVFLNMFTILFTILIV